MNFTIQNIKDFKALMSETIKEETPAIVRSILKEEIGALPTKEEFYSKMDQVLGEIRDMREEHLILSHKVFSHDSQIAALQSDVSTLKKKIR